MLPDDSSSESECESDADGSSCSSSSDSDVFDVIAEIKRKKAHPDRLHDELWYNDPGQVSWAQHTNLLLCYTHTGCDSFYSGPLSGFEKLSGGTVNRTLQQYQRFQLNQIDQSRSVRPNQLCFMPFLWASASFV